MLKKEIKYTDFDGNPQTETHYFNITKAELLEMELGTEEGFSETLKRIVETQKMDELIKHFKKIILESYGVRSPDGKKFSKKDENDRPYSADFVQTAAYDALFMDLATNDNSALEFIRGILPSDMIPQLDKELKEAANSSLVTDAALPPATPAQ